MNARELRAERAALLDETRAMVDRAAAADRDFDSLEERKYAANMRRADLLQAEIEAAETVPASFRSGAPAFNRIGRGDNETRALAQWFRTGDIGGMKHMQSGPNMVFFGPEQRASNDTTMNITTSEDGGYGVPTGLYQEVIARRDETMLANKLQVRRILGKGTTVNVAVDNEDDGEFVSTAESAAYDRDAPALTQVALTLVKYTKKVDWTVELEFDQDVKLYEFVRNFVGRGMAKTHNNLLLTEVAANGTSLKTFASASQIAIDELEDVTFDDNMAPYLDDEASVAWVMRRSVHGEIVKLDDANTRRYASNTMPDSTGRFQPILLGFPVHYSLKSGATAASAKSVYFGNWYYVGLYEQPGFSLIRDPYSRAANGEILYHFAFRCDYGQLVQEACGFGTHPSA